jgi:hypothetical protein
MSDTEYRMISQHLPSNLLGTAIVLAYCQIKRGFITLFVVIQNEIELTMFLLQGRNFFNFIGCSSAANDVFLEEADFSELEWGRKFTNHLEIIVIYHQLGYLHHMQKC